MNEGQSFLWVMKNWFRGSCSKKNVKLNKRNKIDRMRDSITNLYIVYIHYYSREGNISSNYETYYTSSVPPYEDVEYF